MKHFVYMVSDYLKKNIHIGYATDLEKMLKIYDQINEMSLSWPVENYLNRLVYLEEISTDYLAKDRFKIISTLTSKEKREMITELNPTWCDLTADQNFKYFIQTEN